MSTNLPPAEFNDSAHATKLFFDSYGREPLEFNANEVGAAQAFFESKGFDRDAASLTAAVLLKQARLDEITVFDLLDKLTGLNSVQLSSIVAEILNNNRPATSTLGFRVPVAGNQLVNRNIIP
jgi:hypothetical protein